VSLQFERSPNADAKFAFVFTVLQTLPRNQRTQQLQTELLNQKPKRKTRHLHQLKFQSLAPAALRSSPAFTSHRRTLMCLCDAVLKFHQPTPLVSIQTGALLSNRKAR